MVLGPPAMEKVKLRHLSKATHRRESQVNKDIWEEQHYKSFRRNLRKTSLWHQDREGFLKEETKTRIIHLITSKLTVF